MERDTIPARDSVEERELEAVKAGLRSISEARRRVDEFRGLYGLVGLSETAQEAA
jgi:hypothetical protein